MGDASLDATLQRLVLELTAAAERRIRRHPAGHRLATRGHRIDVGLSLPLFAGAGAVTEAVQRLSTEVARAVDLEVARAGLVEPGHAVCLRCASSRCEHAAPEDPRQVFAGYGPTGLPRFVDFGQLLLERGDPRVDQLYADTPPVFAIVHGASEQTESLLDAYRGSPPGFRLHGQVSAGWFRLAEARQAISVQLISTATENGRRLYSLNPVASVDEAPDALPWSGSLAWGENVLRQVEASRRPLPPGRLEGILTSIARRLERDARGRDRRTGHAEARRRSRERPTGSALADLERATAEGVLFDGLRETFVVLGAKNRTHIFSPEGKHVTSLHLPSDAVSRRRQRGRWKAVSEEEVVRLRERVLEVAVEG